MTFALGLWGVRRDGTLWRDEAVTYDMARRSLPDLLHTLAHYDAVHGLYYLLMHGVFAVFGESLLALRLPSVLGTALAAAGTGLLGGRFAGPRAGLLAGLAFPLFPLVQRYAQEGRSYALVCACVTWATWLFLRAADAPHCRRRWTAYAAVALTGCLLHEFAVLAVAAHGVTLALSGAARAARRGWWGAAAGVGAGAAPLAVVSSGQVEQVAWIGAPAPGLLLTCAAAALLGLAVAPGRRRGPLLRTVLPLLLVPPVVLLLLSLLKPLYVDRYVLYALVGAALAAGAVLDRAWGAGKGRWRRAAVIVAVAAVLTTMIPVAVHLRTPRSRLDDVTAVSGAVRAVGGPGDGLVFMPSRRRIWATAGPRDARHPGGFAGLTDLAVDRGPRASHTLYGTELPPGRIRARMVAARRIVAVRDPAGQPVDATAREAVKRAVLREHFEACATTVVRGARITVYARPGHC